MAAREAEVWKEIDALIERKTGPAYDEAIQRLRDLRELAEYQGQAADFQERLGQMREQYSRRTALLRRLDKARLSW